MENSPSGYIKGMQDLENDIKSTERSLLAIADREPDSKGGVQAAASSLLGLLRVKARGNAGMSQDGLQLVRDSCTSLLTPQPGHSHPGPQTVPDSRMTSHQQPAVLDKKLQECCSVLGSAIDSATVAQLAAVLESLYTRQLQLLSQCPQLPGPKNVISLPATAAAPPMTTSHQFAGQGKIDNAGVDQLLPAQRPAPVAVTRRWRFLQAAAQNLAGAEDAPNLASPAPGAAGPMACRPPGEKIHFWMKTYGNC